MDLTGVDLITEAVRTERLLLRPYRRDDVDPVYRACQSPDLQRWLTALPSPYTREAAADFVTGIAPRGRVAGTDLGCAIDVDGELVGSCGLHALTTGRLGPEVGYWVAPWARRQGYASEAARGWRSGRSTTGRRGCTCSPTSATSRRRPRPGRPASCRRASCAAAWSTGTATGATRPCSGGWPGS